MFELTYRMTFCAAHFLRDYDGICKNTHGHNWEAWVTIEGTELAPNGTLIDFYEIEKILEPIQRQLDHGFINDIPPFTEISPTSENLAKWIYEQTAEAFRTDRARLREVAVKEYESSTVTYRPD